jgi:hypothetical protein
MVNEIRDYVSPQILEVHVAPDLTKCMQNTGGIEDSSTFKQYLLVRDSTDSR